MIIGENKPMHKTCNIQIKYAKSVLWTSSVAIFIQDVQGHPERMAKVKRFAQAFFFKKVGFSQQF